MRDEPDPPATCWSSEEITVNFTGRRVPSDYGVPGSPTWNDIEDIEITSIEILGVNVSLDALPANLQTALFELKDEVEW